MEPFAVVVIEGSPTRVRLVGEFDLAGVPVFESAVRGLDGDIELDCSALEFIDAAGMGALVAAHNACDERGTMLILDDPSPLMCHVLGVVGLDALLRIRQTDATS